MHRKKLISTIHMDGAKQIPFNPRFIDDFIQFIGWKYGNPDIGEVKSTRRKIHNYLVINLDYYEKGKVNIGMRDYVNQMNNDFPGELYENYTAMKPANENLLKKNMLSKDKVYMFHTTYKKV